MSMTSTEQNYEIYDKELMAIVLAYKVWRHLLEGAEHSVEVVSNHHNLEYWSMARMLTHRQARWALFLSQFNYFIIHQARRSMGKLDTLSRRSNHNQGEGDNKDMVILPSTIMARAVTVNTEEVGHWLAKAAEWRADPEPEVAKATRGLTGSGWHDGTLWDMLGDYTLRDGRVYILKDPDTCYQITKWCHNLAVTGHPGRTQTLNLISKEYWWLGMA